MSMNSLMDQSAPQQRCYTGLHLRMRRAARVHAPARQACCHAAAPSQQGGLERFGLRDSQQAQVGCFLEYLLSENQKYNLTAVKDLDTAHARHAEDSLALLGPIAEHLQSRSGGSDASVRLLDVGSGPGLPGCILAIARPSWQVTCMDATQKRVAFVQAAAARCGIGNVHAVAERCEVLGHQSGYREVFDVVTARAVAGTRTLVELCLPFVRVGGILVAAKGPHIEAELEEAMPAIEKVGGAYQSCVPVASHSLDGQRHAIVVHKVKATSSKYPRANGVPNKRPL